MQAPEELNDAALKKQTKIEEFVTRLYVKVFNRQPDGLGFSSNVENLKNQSTTGAQILHSFFNNPECLNRNLSDADFVESMYWAAYGRPSDPQGRKNWQNDLKNGCSRNYVLAGFLVSTEYAEMCAAAGINPGSYRSTEPRDQNPLATAFVARMYTKCVNRPFDVDGLNNYTKDLLAGTKTGAEVAYDFFFSGEFQEKNMSNEKFLETMYQTLFDRGSDPTGRTNWLGYFRDGCSRKFVLSGFVGSTEFINLCARYNIKPGTYQSDENRDKNSKLTAFVSRMYTECLKRPYDLKGLNEHAGRLLTKQKTGASLAYDFFNSREFVDKKYSDEEFVRRLYRTMFDHEGEPIGIGNWMSYLKDGLSRNYVLSGFVGSQEYIDMCAKYAITPGTYASTEARDKNRKFTAYANSAFKGLMGREPSTGELNNLAQQLLNKKTGEDLIRSMEGSAEFHNRGLSNTEYVKALYWGLFGRGADPAGLNSYTKLLDNKLSRGELLDRFLQEPEFINRCKDHGVPARTSIGRIRITVDKTGEVLEGEGIEILAGIVAGEMGTGLNNPESYKAQAIAAHSWILYQNAQGNDKPTVAYATPKEAMRKAVAEVANKVIYYNNSVAMTTYSASTGKGYTNSSEAVGWGSKPYLVSVPSKYDYLSDNYQRNYTFTESQMKDAINRIYNKDGKQKIDFSTNASQWLDFNLNNKGVVDVMYIKVKRASNGATHTYAPTANYFKENSGLQENGIPLRSTDFTFRYDANKHNWIFTTYGYGHGVGMSQWGAYFYATKENWTHEQILKHYYPGTTIKEM